MLPALRRSLSIAADRRAAARVRIRAIGCRFPRGARGLRKGRPGEARRGRAQLANHVLAPYVAVLAAPAGLDDASPETVRAFIDRYPNTPLCRPLAQRLAQVPRAPRASGIASAPTMPPLRPTTSSSPATTCCYKWQRDGDGALADALPLWFTGATTPDACEPAFAALVRARARSRSPTGARASVSRARPATSSSRRRSAATFRARIASSSARSATSTRDPLGGARQGQLHLDHGERPRARARSHSSARPAATPAPRARRG